MFSFDETSMDILFDTFDVDGSGTLDISEVISGLSFMCRGTLSEKLHFLFHNHDKDHSGYLEKDEIFKMFQKLTTQFVQLEKAHAKHVIQQVYDHALNPDENMLARSPSSVQRSVSPMVVVVGCLDSAINSPPADSVDIALLNAPIPERGESVEVGDDHPLALDLARRQTKRATAAGERPVLTRKDSLEKMAMHCEGLATAFAKSGDLDGDGKISYEEFEEYMLENEFCKKFLEALSETATKLESLNLRFVSK